MIGSIFLHKIFIIRVPDQNFISIFAGQRYAGTFSWRWLNNLQSVFSQQGGIWELEMKSQWEETCYFSGMMSTFALWPCMLLSSLAALLCLISPFSTVALLLAGRAGRLDETVWFCSRVGGQSEFAWLPLKEKHNLNQSWQTEQKKNYLEERFWSGVLLFVTISILPAVDSNQNNVRRIREDFQMRYIFRVHLKIVLVWI